MNPHSDYCLESITGTDDSINSLMIFGHNPDFTDLVNQFLKEPLSDIPTSGTVKLEFSCDSWKKIDKTNLVRHSFIFPAEGKRGNMNNADPKTYPILDERTSKINTPRNQLAFIQ